jgi:hypothetical protein
MVADFANLARSRRRQGGQFVGGARLAAHVRGGWGLLDLGRGGASSSQDEQQRSYQSRSGETLGELHQFTLLLKISSRFKMSSPDAEVLEIFQKESVQVNYHKSFHQP